MNWKYILIVIAVAVIAGAGILAYLRIAEEPPIIEPVVEEPEILPEEEVELADWKTYRNEEYGFEINYPPDWQLDFTSEYWDVSFDVRGNNFLTKEEYRAMVQAKFDYPLDEKEFEIKWQYFDGSGKYIDDINIKVYPSLFALPGNEKEGLTLNEWIKKRMKEYLIAKGSKKEITINEHKGIEVKELGKTSYRSVFLIRDSLIYNFFLEMERPPEEMDLFNQMLSTFGFIETEDETVKWQVYRNKDYGFEVKYPENWEISLRPAVKGIAIKKENCNLEIWELNKKGYYDELYDEVVAEWCTLEEVIINDISFTHLRCPYKGSDTYYGQKDGRYFQIEIWDNIMSFKAGEPIPPSYLPDCQKYFNQILSTLRFF